MLENANKKTTDSTFEELIKDEKSDILDKNNLIEENEYGNTGEYDSIGET